ncbi:MAG: hypothetical protein FWG90_04580 [Oscillospiraceae bacterium]|nr:hypothetical protein [Oscillospiraceae bacterium]
MYKTMREIEKEYDGNFVCIINYKKSKYHSIIGGEVIAASQDKEKIIDIWAKNPRSHFEYMGEFPDEEGGFLLTWNSLK